MTDLKQQALTVAVLTALGERITEAAKAKRAALLADMAEVGAERVTAALPSGEKVAAVTLAGGMPGRAYVADERAFTVWVAEHIPSEMEYVVRPAYRKRLLEELSKTQEAVPGVEFADARPYLSNRFATGGKDAVAEAWTSGELDLPGLLAIEGGE